MSLKKYGDIIVGVFFMALSLGMIILAGQLPESAIMSVGPSFMPTVIGGITLVLAVILTATSVMKLKKGNFEEEDTETYDYKRVICSFIVILIYVFVMKPVGFIVSTIVYLPIQMFFLAPKEDRKPVKLFLISLVFTLVVFFLFRYGFKIVLPQGIFTIEL